LGYKEAVICTVPRQKIAKEQAEFAAKCMDVPLVKKDPVTERPIWERTQDFYVGYKYGDMTELKSDEATKYLFSTDGTIKVMMTKTNPDLIGYGGIVIDEAHERTLATDILFGVIRKAMKQRNEYNNTDSLVRQGGANNSNLSQGAIRQSS
jgi:HrpA-like RNA helicase